MRVLLPLKEFSAAKQRLAGVLSPVERQHLFQAMVVDVLEVLCAHPQLGPVTLCSRDPAAAWLASHFGVECLAETELGASGLNPVVNAAARHFAARGESELLVVHGDLPLLDDTDIDLLLQAHRGQPGATVTLAPDQLRQGTNLLAWRPLGAFRTEYGPHSFQRHCAQAERLGMALSICALPGGRCDVDEPADLLALVAEDWEGRAGNTLKFLHESGLARRLRAMLQGEGSAPLGERYGRV
jgi:2-phospho-L-lactate guanylyltransferase